MNSSSIPFAFLFFLLLSVSDSKCRAERGRERVLRFGQKRDGEFKILQIADMHYANGKDTGCLNVPEGDKPFCSDLNTTAFIHRVIEAEEPDLVVFTGDNIYGKDSTDAAKSMDMAFEPVVELGQPWAAVLGNHDQEGTLSRQGVMQYIVGKPHTLSQFNPTGVEIDGYGNYNLEVAGTEGSSLANKSVLNLFFLDSGDYAISLFPFLGYGWIHQSQQDWFKQTSSHLQEEYKSEPNPQEDAAPALTYFHIPLPELKSLDPSDIVGVKQEGIGSPWYNSGFFKTMVETGDVKAVLLGHDHKNDFCGKLTGIQLCYAGGFGYHAYGKVGWSRRARVVTAYLEKTHTGEWGGVESINTWKRLDDKDFTIADYQVLWSKGDSNGRVLGDTSTKARSMLGIGSSQTRRAPNDAGPN